MIKKIKKKLKIKSILLIVISACTCSFGLMGLYYIITKFNSILKEEHILFIPFAIFISTSMIISSYFAEKFNEID